MSARLLYALLAIAVPVAFAQAPVEDARVSTNALLQAQQKASAAYRDLRQAEFEAKRAEQDFYQADADYKAAQKRADELKRSADAAKKNLDAAQANEVSARKSHAAAVNAVDQVSRPASSTK